ncbi:MAG: hypothetical protein ACTSRB_14995 [Candidatus Helarchaeota archaeon]
MPMKTITRVLNRKQIDFQKPDLSGTAMGRAISPRGSTGSKGLIKTDVQDCPTKKRL